MYNKSVWGPLLYFTSLELPYYVYRLIWGELASYNVESSYQWTFIQILYIVQNVLQFIKFLHMFLKYISGVLVPLLLKCH